MEKGQLEKTQEEVLEQIVQNCFEPTLHTNETSHSEQVSAIFREAEEALAKVSVSDVADKLEELVMNIGETLQQISGQAQQLAESPKELAHFAETVNEDQRKLTSNLQAVSMSPEVEQQLANPPPPVTAEYLKNLMTFTEESCAQFAHALASIDRKEIDFAAQFCLDVAHKLLPAGESMLLCLNEEMQNSDDRSSRITIEELEEEEEGQYGRRSRQKGDGQSNSYSIYSNRKEPHYLRQYLDKLYTKTLKYATERPYIAGILTAIGLPFSGLLVPLAGVVGVALLIENYYPEYAAFSWQLLSNTIQFIKLWMFILKISITQCGMVLKTQLKSWYTYTSEKGIIATGGEVASVAYGLGSRVLRGSVSLSHQLFS